MKIKKTGEIFFKAFTIFLHRKNKYDVTNKSTLCKNNQMYFIIITLKSQDITLVYKYGQQDCFYFNPCVKKNGFQLNL